MPGAIFVSYRRATTSNAAGRLADRLMNRFGEEQVFVDVDAIEPGVDFVEVIENAVAACRVMLVVIGPTWHTEADATGRRRLDDPQDPVVVEVRAGLAIPAIRVIPVLVDGAEMPRVEDLPPTLHLLARINAARIDHATFRRDALRLAAVVEVVLTAPPSRPLAPAEQPALDRFPPPTTSFQLEFARRLEIKGTEPVVLERVVAAYCRAIASGHADVPLAWAGLGWYLMQTDATEIAGEALKQAVASGHPTAEPMGRLGRAGIAYLRNDLDEAEGRFRSVAGSPYRAVAVMAMLSLACVSARRRDFAGARSLAERAVAMKGSSAQPWTRTVGAELVSAGDVEGATALLRWVLSQPVDEPTATAARELLAEHTVLS